MRQNPKFEKKIRYRQRLALFLTLLTFVTAFAAIAYGENLVEHLPDFIQQFFEKESAVPRA